MFNRTQKLLYNARVIGVKAPLHSSPSSLSRPLQYNTTRCHSLFWQRAGIDWARAKIKINPRSQLENGGSWFFFLAFEWVFVGILVWATFPWFLQIQHVGHWCTSNEYHNLRLQDDTYRDPLIPPADVWNRQNRQFIEETKIRKARMDKQQARLAGK
mmetsp:Transcript_5217/g.8618  ORF Transcript_5217/g.8618 Transcript_5217/m.8618 type:complete len:157 (-) Transcript_5217:164-634(-)